MATPEEQQRPDDMIWSQVEDIFRAPTLGPEDIGVTLLKIIARHDELMQEAGRLDRLCKWDEAKNDMPVIATPKHGNELEIRVERHDVVLAPARSISIGFFSAAEGGYVLFPELVVEDEAEDVLLAALLEREAELERFNEHTSKGLVRYDLTDPLVRVIHEKHNDYLSGGGISLMGIVDGRNEQLLEGTPEERKRSYFEVDQQTQGVICMPPDKGTGCHNKVALRMAGAFNYLNGVKVRLGVEYIDLATLRGDESSPEAEYVPAGKTIKPYEIEELTELADGLLLAKQEVGLSGRELDLAEVAVRAHPQSAL